MAHLIRETFQAAALAILTVGAILLFAACAGGDEARDESEYAASQAHDAQDSAPASVVAGQHSEAGLAGKLLFAANCSQCHGDTASGTNQGPPLVHQIYEPGHHSNASFVIAVARGVRAHHWDFGNMPAVSGLEIDQIHQVICFVRELQLANDIIDEVPTSTPC